MKQSLIPPPIINENITTHKIKHTNHIMKKILLAAVAMAMAFGGASAQQKQEYVFRHAQTPKGIDRYATTVLAYGDNVVAVMNGRPLAMAKGGINDLKISPVGLTYGIVGGEGKKSFFKVMQNNTNSSYPQVFDFPRKKIGNPTAFAFSPDGRQILVATDNGKITRIGIQGKKYVPGDTIALVAPARYMTVSPNGYFVAAISPNGVDIYNLEENRLRTTLSPDAAITDVRFSDDSSELGVTTDDGVFRSYDSRTFLIKRSVDDLGQASAFAYNQDGKYIGVVTSPGNIVLVNLVDPDDRQYIAIEDGGISDLEFVPDAQGITVLINTANKSLHGRRLESLTPFFSKLVSTEADALMNQWMMMLPDETMEEYQLRVNPESIAAQRRLFEDEIATGFADNLLEMSSITLGQYDAKHELQEINFDNMPSIYLPVPTADKDNFTTAESLQFRDVRYGIMPNDKFEMIYANVYNTADGKTYVFDNVNRAPLAFMQDDDDDPMTVEVIQQQQMEELVLQEIKERVIEEAKKDNIISDHTNITVDSRIEPDYNANGDKILNYKVKFTYEVDPGFSATEDFGPGKYHVDQSGAASSMLSIVRQAMADNYGQYIEKGKKVRLNISGTADASPIRSRIAYDGIYGDFEDEPVTKDGQLTGITVTKAGGITENEQLAFLRAAGVRDYLLNNVEQLRNANPEVNYFISVAEGKGSEFRRITAEFTFVDAF